VRDALAKSVPFERRRDDGEAGIGPATDASGGHALGVQVTGHVLQVQTGRFGRHGDLGIGANACASETVATDRVVPSEETTSAGADSANWKRLVFGMFGGQTVCVLRNRKFPRQ
jgi:hypothetical protein